MSEPTPLDEIIRPLFEKWWKKKMGDRMKGSKYLAWNAWSEATKIENKRLRIFRE